MGAAQSVLEREDTRVQKFRDALTWAFDKQQQREEEVGTNKKQLKQLSDAEILDYINHTLCILPNQKASSEEEQEEVRGAEATSSSSRTTSRPSTGTSSLIHGGETYSVVVEDFGDSFYAKNWLSREEADALFAELAAIGEPNRPSELSAVSSASKKYPLWTETFGLKREKDNCRALDRWGSYHESWLRVKEPPTQLSKVCDMMRSRLNLPTYAVNSIVVNYYWEGDTTYIPAHRDTVHCLEENSKIYCLSLGASRDFVLSCNDDNGKFVKEDLNVAKEWRVGHGDLFALGFETNQQYVHSVPQAPGLKQMRISCIFRTVTRSFIDLESSEHKDATYFVSGKTKTFSAEVVATENIDDDGKREHIAELIQKREDEKRLKKTTKKMLHEENAAQYYMGEGRTVLLAKTKKEDDTTKETTSE